MVLLACKLKPSKNQVVLGLALGPPEAASLRQAGCAHLNPNRWICIDTV